MEHDDNQIRQAFDTLCQWLLTLLIVVILTTIAGFILLSCAGVPRPPRGKYTMEQAQQYVRRMSTPEMRERGYRPVKTK